MPDKLSHPDFSRFDALSTEKLKEILYQDSFLPEDEALDPNLLIYISKIVAEREQQIPGNDYPDTKDALSEFRRYYLPTLDDEDWGEDVENAPPQPIPSEKKQSKRPVRFIISIAAAVAIVLTLISAAYAGVFDWFARWTKDDFYLLFGDREAAAIEDATSDVLDKYALFCYALSEYNVPNNIVPPYIPEGYVFTDFETISIDHCDLLIATFKNSDGNMIHLDYSIYSESISTLYPKDEDSPDTYVAGGVDHIILTNMGNFQATWQRENVECSISGYLSRDELIKSIDSMY